MAGLLTDPGFLETLGALALESPQIFHFVGDSDETPEGNARFVPIYLQEAGAFVFPNANTRYIEKVGIEDGVYRGFTIQMHTVIDSENLGDFNFGPRDPGSTEPIEVSFALDVNVTDFDAVFEYVAPEGAVKMPE